MNNNATTNRNTFDELPENTFVERIYKLRKKAGYSQEKMGEFLGIDGRSYGKYEQDTCVPGIDRLTQLADLFNVSIDYLWLGTTSSTIERVTSLLSKYDESVQDNILNIIENMLAMMYPENTH